MHCCCRGGWPNSVRVIHVVLVCVCVFLNACMLLYVTDQKGAKTQKIINWVPFVLPLSMTESERSLPWPRVHEPWKNDTSNWATRMQRVSCHIGRRGGWRLLTSQDGHKHQPTLAMCVATTCTPSPLFFFSLTPDFSLNIFTSPDSENTVNSLCDIERAAQWGKCVRCMCDVVFELRATPTTRRSSANVNRHTHKKRIIHADQGGEMQGDWATAWKSGGYHCTGK